MSRIGRETFVSEMGQGLDIKGLSPEAQAALKQAGIDPAKLAAVAGEDGVVSEQDELDALFTLMDTKDRDGSYDSIATTKKSGEATVSGQLYEALKGERERARLGAPAAPPPKPSAEEAKPPANARFRPTEAAHEKGVSALEQLGFTEIHIAKHTPYFNQADSPWADDIYPKVGEKDSKRTLKDARRMRTRRAGDRRRHFEGQRHRSFGYRQVRRRPQVQRPARRSGKRHPPDGQGLGQGKRPRLHSGAVAEPERERRHHPRWTERRWRGNRGRG